MTEEIWKSIDGYDGKYAVSNFGNVKSFARYKDGKIMKPLNNGQGYLQVDLYNNGVRKCRVHRLVLQAFLPIEEIKEVNHKNHITTDNRLENLEWCSCSENIRFKKKREGLSSQYLGVSWHKRDNKWLASCHTDKNIFLGYFDDEHDAGRAYNDFVIKHDLQHFTKLNEIN